MTLISLEGPSAVGKTTTSKALADHYAAYIIPEVNQLFERPAPEPTYWYFERQVERWTIAQEKLKTHELVVFDGDPFQPLWYNWSYNFVDWQPLEVLRDFYRQHIVAQTLGFPDAYIVLTINEIELRPGRVIIAVLSCIHYTIGHDIIVPLQYLKLYKNRHDVTYLF